MYAQFLKSINTFVGSIEDIEAFYKKQGKPVPYRREFNPMSSRWVIMTDKNSCQAAGLSEAESECAVLYYTNKQIQRDINQAA